MLAWQVATYGAVVRLAGIDGPTPAECNAFDGEVTGAAFWLASQPA